MTAGGSMLQKGARPRQHGRRRWHESYRAWQAGRWLRDRHRAAQAAGFRATTLSVAAGATFACGVALLTVAGILDVTPIAWLSGGWLVLALVFLQLHFRRSRPGPNS